MDSDCAGGVGDMSEREMLLSALEQCREALAQVARPSHGNMGFPSIVNVFAQCIAAEARARSVLETCRGESTDDTLDLAQRGRGIG